MGEESSTSTTTLPKIPTVAKVQDMINKSLKANTNDVNNLDLYKGVDNLTWTKIEVEGEIGCFGYHDGIYVCLGNAGKGYYSYDGINWESNDIPVANWCSICYLDKKFAAVASDSDLLYYSYDGKSWEQKLDSFGVDGYDAGYKKIICNEEVGYAYVFAKNKRMSCQLNQISDVWNSEGTSALGDMHIYDMSYAGQTLIAITTDDYLYVYTTGKYTGALSSYKLSGFSNESEICYGRGIYLVVGQKGVARISSDLKNFEDVDMLVDGVKTNFTTIYDFYYCLGAFFIVSDIGVYYTLDMKNWKLLEIESNENNKAIFYNERLFIGNNGYILVSNQAITNIAKGILDFIYPINTLYLNVVKTLDEYPIVKYPWATWELINTSSDYAMFKRTA